jgi:hypothetical protein
VTLVIGADENRAYLGTREIRLTKWDPYLFAQGVVIFAFEDLLPDGERMAVAKRAVTWADSTVDAKSPAPSSRADYAGFVTLIERTYDTRNHLAESSIAFGNRTAS